MLCDIFISLFLICILQYIWKHICFAYHLTYKLTWNIIGGYIDPTPTDKPSHEHEPNPLHIASWHLSTSIYNQFTQSEVWSLLYFRFNSTIGCGKSTLNLRFCTKHPQVHISEWGFPTRIFYFLSEQVSLQQLMSYLPQFDFRKRVSLIKSKTSKQQSSS